MDEDLLLTCIGMAAYWAFFRGRPQTQNRNQVVRRPRRMWQRGMLARRRHSSQFFTLMQELNDGNVKFSQMLINRPLK